MVSIDDHPENNRKKSDIKPKKKTPVFLIILVFILAVALGYLGYRYSDQLRELEETEEMKAELERHKVRLEQELKDVYAQYDSLRTENDSINQLLFAEQEKIERLLKINANNVYKIRLYEKELETIRKVLRSYIVQIDSLNQANIALRTENVQVRKQLTEVQKERNQISQEKEELTEKVDKASVLTAKNIIVTPLNKRSKEHYKTSKIVKIRVCFILRENPIIPPGPKTVYIRIARPDEVILTSEVAFFEYEGEQIVYTAHREVDYENKDVEMCIFWTNDRQLIPGDYHVNLFSDGSNIGSTSFSLK